MITKQKAIDIWSSYRALLSLPNAPLGNKKDQVAKECSLYLVDEIINSSPSLPILSDNGTYGSDIEESLKYWNDVKSEIEKL